MDPVKLERTHAVIPNIATPVVPVTPALVPWPGGALPIPDTVPFTARSGATFAEIFYEYRHHLDKNVIPTLDANVKTMVEAWASTGDELVTAVNKGLTDQVAEVTNRLNNQANAVNLALTNQQTAVDNQLTNQQTVIDSQLADQNESVSASVISMTNYVNNAVDSIINSTIDVSDPVLAGVWNNQNSSFRQGLDGEYAKTTQVDNIAGEVDETKSRVNDVEDSLDDGFLTKMIGMHKFQPGAYVIYKSESTVHARVNDRLYVNFIAPKTGCVRITFEGKALAATVPDINTYAMSLFEGTTLVPDTVQDVLVGQSARVSVSWTLFDLLPGKEYTLHLGHARRSGTGNVGVEGANTAGPMLMSAHSMDSNFPVPRFFSDFAGQGIAQYANPITPEHAFVVNDPVIGANRKVVRMLVDNTDVGATPNPRVQLGLDNEIYGALPGDDVWVGFGLYLPANFPEFPPPASGEQYSGWWVFHEMYGFPASGQSAAVLGAYGPGDKLMMNKRVNGQLTWQNRIWEMPVQRSKWLDFVIHVKLSRHATIGFYEMWVNTGNGYVKQNIGGSDKYYFSTLNDSHDRGANVSAIKSYRKLDMFAQLETYMAEHRVGRSFQEVDPRSYSWPR